MAGKYTDIIEVVAPSPVVLGQTVTVRVKAKNIYTAQLYFYIIGVVQAAGGTQVRFIDWVGANVNPGAVLEASGSFIPAGSPGTLTVNIYTWYKGVDGYVHSDDSESRTITVTSTPSTYTGVITKKQLDLGSGTKVDAPASGIVRDTRVLLRVSGRNTTTSTQRMGVKWVIKDPDGLIRESYSVWELFPYTGAGSEHEFLGDRFAYNKVGTWSVNIELLMNEPNPVIVDSYGGTLCTVGAEGDGVPEPPGGYKGVIETLSVLLGKGGIFDTIFDPYSLPVVDVKIGYQFKLNVFARNTSTDAERLGLHYIITKPDGSAIENTILETWPYTGPGKLHEFVEPGFTQYEVDQAGKWTLKIELIAESISNILDARATDLFTEVQEAPASTWGTIGDMIPMLIIIMMMTMMMEQTRGLYEPAGTPPRPKPVSEAVERGAKGVVKYTGKAIKKVTEYFGEGEGD